MNCTLCEKEGKVKRDRQKHIMKCPEIRKELNNQETIKYKNLKSDIITDQLCLVKQLRIHYKIREKFIHKDKTPIRK